MSVQPPNFTQVPNEIIALMADMGDCELLVVIAICRATFGWHKKRDRISITQLEAVTGLSRQGVLNGTAQAMERGIVTRFAVSNGFEYEIEVVNVVDCSGLTSQRSGLDSSEGSQRSRPEVVNYVDQISQKLVNVVDTQKKAEKESSKQKQKKSARANEIPSQADAPPPPLWSDARVAAYAERFKKSPTQTNARIIQSRVAAGDIDLWREVLRAWGERGWSGSNIAGMCERYESAVIARQAAAEKVPAGNGSHSRFAPPAQDGGFMDRIAKSLAFLNEGGDGK